MVCVSAGRFGTLSGMAGGAGRWRRVLTEHVEVGWSRPEPDLDRAGTRQDRLPRSRGRRRNHERNRDQPNAGGHYWSDDDIAVLSPTINLEDIANESESHNNVSSRNRVGRETTAVMTDIMKSTSVCAARDLSAREPTNALPLTDSATNSRPVNAPPIAATPPAEGRPSRRQISHRGSPPRVRGPDRSMLSGQGRSFGRWADLVQEAVGDRERARGRAGPGRNGRRGRGRPAGWRTAASSTTT